MRQFQLYIVTISLLLLILSSCGDDPKDNASASFVKVDCTLDPDVLAKILKVDAKAQLKCLEQNFSAFERYVERENDDYISQDQLGNFIFKFFQKNSAKIFSAMKLFFKINMLVLNDQSNRISTENIRKMTALLITSNQEAIKLSSILKNINNANFDKSRNELKESLHRFTRLTLDVIDAGNSGRGADSNLNIKDFLKELNSIEGVDLDLETINAFLFLKKLLVGGDSDVVTGQELKSFIRKLPDVATLVFDIYFTSIRPFRNDADLFKFYANKISDLQHLIFTGNRNDVLFNVDDLIVILQKIPNNTTEMAKFRNSLMVFKSKFVGGDPADYTFDDFIFIISDIKDLFKMVYFNYITYSNAEISTIMDLDAPILSLPHLNLEEYSFFTPGEVRALQENFLTVAQKTRLFRTTEGLQFFTQNYHRTKYGFNEASIIRWFVGRLHSSYGERGATSRNTYYISLPILHKFFNDFSPILQEFDLWPANPEEIIKFTENTLNLTDLFQTNSNGDSRLDVNESTEYAALVITALNVGERFRKTILDLNLCENSGESAAKPAFDVGCFRQHYFSILFETLKYNDWFATLYDYYKNASPADRMIYLKKIEMFARDDISPTAKIMNKDIVKIFGAMLCLESATIRFDLNRSNVLEPSEVDASFVVYENIINKLMAEDKEAQPSTTSDDDNKYSLSTFKFLLKYMRAPNSTMEFLRFHWFQDKKIYARRLNVGSLLCYVVRGDECSKPMLDEETP